MEGRTGMNWNIILYIGLAFYLLVFITFFVYQTYTRKLEIELFKQQQLNKSFEKGKNYERNKI
jgi:hypothetical protein